MNNEKEIKNLKNVNLKKVYGEFDNIKFEKFDNDINIDKGLVFNGPDVEDLSKLESINIHNDIMRVLADIATANMDSKILSEEEEVEEIETEYVNNTDTAFEEKLDTKYSRILQSDPMSVTYYNINNNEQTTDSGFLNIENPIGEHSVPRFNQVKNSPIYNTPSMQLDINDVDYGLDLESDEPFPEESPIITEALNIRHYIEDGLYKNENINQNLKEYNVRVRLMYPEGITKETENCLNNDKQNGEIKLPIILILFGTPVISISLFRSIEFSLHKIVNDINIINDDDIDISEYIEEIYISYDMFNDLEETSEEIILDYSPSYKSYSEFVMRHDNKILRGPNGIVEFKGFGIDDCSLTHVAIYRDLDKDQLYHSIPIYEIFNGEFSSLNKE